ncbi:putative KHG/KDPG aldolase [Rubripirellula tenax]|uniref:Putative KHG/KDPG aldolase n=1 Tax=Rubripirellula tenax TaxID=2528015 RepID=A0A5C6FLG5_9BACT|nr:bifunctional 4-hydroxy-2-oxoglutarate aldolase/2-dehydro-3-deoxy-phosphogluconate aldolase [Rubripirellula tenax]TWU60857.1 putative KHG/KDPG aldolase [Rubripirellula tenax]
MTSDADFSPELLARIGGCGAMAVVMIDNSDDAVPLAKALLACHIDVMEVTFRTRAAAEAMKRIRDEVPGMLVGAGTILMADQVHEAIAAGAAFGVAPGLSPAVVREARQNGFPFAPGVITPSEMESAIELGCRQLKVFPIEPIGGIKYLRTMAMPYEHLGIRYFVSGGINPENMTAYLYHNDIIAVGGAWIAPQNFIRHQNWSAVIDNAIEAAAIVKEMKVK